MKDIKPFVVDNVDTENRVVQITIRGDCIGTIANHLKSCPRDRKSAKVAIRLGYELSAAGDQIFQKLSSTTPG